MRKINILIIVLILILISSFGLLTVPNGYAQILTLFSNPFAFDPTSLLFGTFQYIPQFPIAPFLPGYPLNFVVDLYEVYDSTNPSAIGPLTELPIPSTLVGQGWPPIVIMPIGATYPGAFVTMQYSDPLWLPPTLPTTFANYYPYATSPPYPYYFINPYGGVSEYGWDPTTSFLIYSLLDNLPPGVFSIPYVAFFNPVSQTIDIGI